jgi:hypothetical protein
MMNERIKELIAQATEVFEPNDPDYRHEIFHKKKFAELIVRECARLCNDFDVYYADNSLLKRETALETSRDLADMMLEHFGVEE